jgi:hypothetical protein
MKITKRRLQGIINESVKKVLNEGVSIEALNDNGGYYTISRLYKKNGNYKWVDEERTFTTCEEAENYAKNNAGQFYMRGATNRFLITKEQPIEIITIE